jgi:hypothetical protein
VKLVHRFAIVLVVIVVALAAQGALLAHLEQGNRVTPGKLTRSLSEFPMAVGDWIGTDQPIEENLKYGDDHLQRVYRNYKTGQQLVLWMIYSQVGKDREHHPEVCMKARGLPEDPTARETVPAPGHAKPVQKYRYGHKGEQQLVYYWHYRLPSTNVEQLNLLQRTYRDARHPPASITIEIFAPQQSEGDEVGAKDFMLAVDEQMQPLVGESALRGNDRKPVSLTLVEETAETTQP